jgi:hypothetical protein
MFYRKEAKSGNLLLHEILYFQLLHFIFELIHEYITTKTTNKVGLGCAKLSQSLASLLGKLG